MSSPPPKPANIEPYRLFFPLGLGYGVLGAALWVIAAAGWVPYPAALHRILMIEGFEQSFIVGFLLTAIPGLTHSERARPAEMAIAFAALVGCGLFALLERGALAHLCYLASLALLAVAALRRLPKASQPPPEEFLFVAIGLLLGIAGAVLLVLESFGVEFPLPARFADRLLSQGMVLTLVLGVGSLLVPTFIGMRGPLEIPGVAAAHQRGPRRALYLALGALLITAFVLEGASLAPWGARLRASAATIIVALVWKIYRGPGRGDLSAWAMWSAGVLVPLGLWVAAIGPRWTLAGLHVVFIGGFGLLTFAIATRVVVAHGKYGIQAEPRVLTRMVATLIGLALLARLAGELRPDRALHWFALSAALWVGASTWWFAAAWPRIRRIATAGLMPHSRKRGGRRRTAPLSRIKAPRRIRDGGGRAARARAAPRRSQRPE